MTAAEEARLLPEGSESIPAQVSATPEEETPDHAEPQRKMSEAPTRPSQTSLESRPETDSQPGAIRVFYGRTKDLAAGIFKEVLNSTSWLARDFSRVRPLRGFHMLMQRSYTPAEKTLGRAV